MAVNNLGFNQDFPIYNADGTAFHDLIIHQSSVESAVMSLGDKISGDVFYKDNTLVVTMGEYIVYDEVKYVLVNPPTIVRNGMVSDNNGTNGMTKYSFVFYHPMYMLGNFPFSDIAVTNDETKYLSQSKTFSWIGNLFEFIAKLNKNLENTDWYVAHNIARYDNNNEETSEWQKATKLSDVLSFDKQFISDALKTAYDTWEIPFVIIQEENAEHKHFGIIFGLPDQEILDSNGNPFVFRFGKGVGLKNNSRTPRNNKIVTRIVGYGSERNIPYGYPQIPWYGNPDWSYTINNDPNEPNSLPIYDGILGGQSVRLIKHPFTRTTLMPSLYCEILFDKVSPYLPDGTSNTYYDPTLDLIDFYEADNTYPNPIIADAPSVEIHQFEDIYPELGEADIVDAVPYDQDGEYYTYAQWYTYLQGRITDMQNNNVEGWQMELVQTMFNVTCPYTPEDAEEDPTAAIFAGHWEWNTGQATATLDVTIKGNFVYVKLVSSWYNEEHKIVQIHADPTPVWDDTMNDNGEYIQSYFEMTLPQLSFDLYACAAITEEMKINMRGGACKGCTFPVAVDWDDYKKNFYKDDGTFDPVIHTTEGDGHVRDGSKFPDSRQGQITILVKKEIETFGTLMPNVYQQPKTGDAFVILGISLPQSYVEDAQWRLDEAMQEYMLENNVYYYDYPLTFDEHFLATHTDILAQMHNNSIVRFQYAGIEMALYIKQMNIKFGTKVLPEYEITLTDDVEIVLNKIGQVTDDVSRMRVQVSELQKYYSENLIQEINSKLSRMVDDVCAGRITFQQGLYAIGAVIFHDKLQSPQFQEGLYRGSGWRVDNLGNAEFESLRIRSFLEVVELLVNRMQAQEGDTVFTDNDQIEKVDIITINNETQYVLTLKEKYQGYITTQVDGNIIKGIINTLAAEQSGITPHTQNPPLYFTSWMHVEETHSTPNSTLGTNQIRVSLYGDNDVPSGKNYVPCELMTIARWGNTLDPNASDISAAEKARRQRLRSTFYISTSEGRIAKLIDVNAPKLVAANYGTTLGELPDFVKAYSSVAPRLQEGRDYLYAQGVVVEDFIKITRQGNPIYEYVDCGEWVNGASVTPSVGHGIYLFQEFNSITGQYETHEVWHNNAKWRVKMHQPVTIGGVSTYYEPSDTNTTYWQKLEEAAQGTSYEIKWTDPFGVVSNIPCSADGIAKYKSGGGTATWLTATLYKREGNNAPTAFVVAGIELFAYKVDGSEVWLNPRTATNASSISLENYDAVDSIQNRYLVVFMDAQNNIIESSSIARDLDGEDGEDGQDGQRGKMGRWLYYGGVFDATNTSDTFVISDVQAPFFQTSSNTFHVFNYGVNGAYTMAQMYAIQPNFNNLPWEIATNDFQYLITKAIFSDQALLGSFAIKGDWMISQHGTIDGVASTNYTAFDPTHPNDNQGTNFIPNFAVNGETGATYQHDGYFDGTIKSANAEITGKVTANEGKIGKFSISNDGLYDGTYNPNTWYTNPENFVFVNTSMLRIGQKDSYSGHTYAWTSVFMGQQSDPEEQNPDNYCDCAMYVYRRMVEGHNPYKPAVKIISHNAGNIDVGMRLQGALQVHGGGVIEQGKYILRASTSDVNSVDLTKGTTFVINYQLHTQVGNVDYSNVNNRNIYLPSLSEVQTQLGIASNTPFAIPITISAHLNTYDFHICSPNGVFIYDNVGNILNNQGTWNYLNMSHYYVVRLILTYDGTSDYYIQRAGAFT
jgi:hypothetical protein